LRQRIAGDRHPLLREAASARQHLVPQLCERREAQEVEHVVGRLLRHLLQLGDASEDAELLQPGIRLRRNAVEGGRDERSDRRRQPR
jgi:hypothetical protein